VKRRKACFTGELSTHSSFEVPEFVVVLLASIQVSATGVKVSVDAMTATVDRGGARDAVAISDRRRG